MWPIRPTPIGRRLARPVLVVALGIAALLAGCGPLGGDGPAGASDGFVEPPPPPAPSGMPQIRLDELPDEAIFVLDLIEQGGPYPFEQDGAVFENREGLLPARPRGHYREYTVETPGEDDRGARRIVAGADGERFWTDDHYDSFAWIAE